MGTQRRFTGRRPVAAGNWKMHKTTAESAAAARGIARRLKTLRGGRAPEVFIAPSFTALKAVAEAVRGSGIIPTAQNAHWELQGGFTGEISPVQIREAGGRAVILGHSERRRMFGETDESVNRKLVSAIRFKLRAILCIGETPEERRAERTAERLKIQLSRALAGCSAGDSDGLIVAYEPVWAIGTGQTATPMQIAAAHDLIRKELSGLLGPDAARMVRILYGGSVTPGNIGELAAIQELDGVLVGGASLQPDGFAKIVKTLFKIKQEE